MFELIASQGRVADRSALTIEGAARTAEALEYRYGVKARYIGNATAPANDDWRVSLPEARDTLIKLRQAIEAVVVSGNTLVICANTCSASLASLPVVAKYHPDSVVLWIDAHGDFNTPETTATGYLGGMVLSGACGVWDSGHGSGLRPQQVILIGARDIDGPERELLRGAGVRILSPKEATPAEISKAINGAKVWIHLDWDVLEPGFVPADYMVPGGVLPTQMQAIFESIPHNQLIGIELAEFRPPADHELRDAALSVILKTVSSLLGDVDGFHQD